MDFNATIDIILKDLRDIREIIDDLKNYPGIPRFQVELAFSKCKSAEEVIALLKSLKSAEIESNVAADKSVKPEKSNDEPAIKRQITQEPAAEETRMKHPENMIEISDEADDEGIIVQTPPHSHDKKAETTIIADKFSGKPNILLDQFGSSKKEDDIASVMKSKYVENLSDAIGINDKFLFIREIFAGSQPAYDEAIQRLNAATSFSDARAIIMSYSGEGEENEVVKQFLEIVKRKIPSDG